MVKAVERVYDATKNKANIFICWRQISAFLKELPAKCSSEIFTLFAAGISVKLLRKFQDVRNVKEDDNVMQSIIFCLSSMASLAETVSHKKRKCSEWIYSKSVFVIDEFFDLIKEFPIFLEDDFEGITLEILENGSKFADPKTLTKFLKAIHSTLDSHTNSEARTNMSQYLMTTQNVQRLSVMITWEKATREMKVLVLQILKALLQYVLFIYCL